MFDPKPMYLHYNHPKYNRQISQFFMYVHVAKAFFLHFEGICAIILS